METYEIILIKINTKEELTVQVEVDEAENSENIVINAQISGQEITSANYNYLPAYQEFRDKLLEAGYGIKCNGSRLNAVQSGMMGATDKVYLVEIGKQALTKDIVHIWDYADIEDFPNTRMQTDFFEQCIIQPLSPESFEAVWKKFKQFAKEHGLNHIERLHNNEKELGWYDFRAIDIITQDKFSCDIDLPGEWRKASIHISNTTGPRYQNEDL